MLMRNILRNQTFEILKQQRDIRIVVLILNIYNIESPRYLVEGLEAENVIFEFVKNRATSKLQRWFKSATNYLVFSESSRYYIAERPEVKTKVSNLYLFFFGLVYKPLSKSSFLKKAVRGIELFFYRNKNIARFFDKYSPDLVFSTAIQSGIDVEILKEAKKRKLKTISMPKSWDNIGWLLFRVEPDIFLVQNDNMKDQAVKYQAINPQKIKVVGFPQFDIYKEDVLISKETYCAEKGLDPGLPILFLGSEGLWSEGDDKIFEELIFCREKGEIKNCNIVIRPHFSNVQKNKYEKFKHYKNLYIDGDFRKSSFFGDKWDPTRQDQINFTNLLYHCNALVTFASTLALDMACFNKPIIAVCYGTNFKNGEDVTEKMYTSVHYKDVIDTGAATLTHSKEELMEAVNKFLENSYSKQEEVRMLRKNLCGILDGKSGERIARSVFDYLYR